MGGFFVVDGCQGRWELDWLNDLLLKDVIVLHTGSKFFRGPPFSGCVFVPKNIMDRIKAA